MRKLTAVENNVFTSKVLDLITPEFDSSTSESLDHMFIVMECIDQNLKETLDSVGTKYEFSDDHLKIILYNALCSLNFLHSANIIHRDIKPANLLLDEQCTVSICDFGLARTRSKQPYKDMDEYVKTNMTEE